jgi:hypothetical protein
MIVRCYLTHNANSRFENYSGGPRHENGNEACQLLTRIFERFGPPPSKKNQKDSLLTTKFEVDKSTTAERQEEEEMRNELLKGFAMLVLVVALAAATAAATTPAQSANRVVANIPFEFSVGYKTMPAGEYQIRIVNSANDALLIQSADSKTSALRLSEATERQKNNKHAKLVFHRYGERYFLAERHRHWSPTSPVAGRKSN